MLAISSRAVSKSLLNGGIGNDTITGSSASDQIFGQSGNDTLLGRGGDDLLFGGDGNDDLAGGIGNDQVFGGAGDDRFVWNAGDGTDLVEGGSDIDTVEANGSKASETFAVTANGDRVRFDRLDADPSSLDIGTTEKLIINAGGGNDKISAVGNLAALIELKFDGGAGDDTILGGNGNDILLGGDGNDFVDGNQGADQAWLGAGNDVFQWDPGDGNDVVEGGAGLDTVIFSGSNIGENIDISANLQRLSLTRDIANISMDMDDVETIRFEARSGADNILVHDLTGTDAKLVAINLAGTGGTGDGQVDLVTAQGTSGSDAISLTANGSQITVHGLFAQLTIDQAEAGDKLIVGGGDGDDIIDGSAFAPGAASLLLSGDGGDDILDGSAAGDTLLGGLGGDVLFGNDGDDTISGGAGDDLLFGGAGNDTFRFTTALDGHDIIVDFDGDAAGGQDVFDLDQFFDGSEVVGVNREDRVLIDDNGASVNLFVDADGIAANGFEVLAATLNTSDTITLGTDVVVGSLV